MPQKPQPILALAAGLLLAACINQVNVIDADGGANRPSDTEDEREPMDGDDGNEDETTDGGSIGIIGPPRDPDGLAEALCRRGGLCQQVQVTNVDKVDLLFVVDNSRSMLEEQASLRREFPRLIYTLTTGGRDLDGERDFAPAKDLHLGVVSTDLGLTGVIGIDSCIGLGDDGVMNNVPTMDPGVTGCDASYPARFLSYHTDVNDPLETANDFACLATLGTNGCGFEQQLESGLKALWPSDDSRVTFLPDTTGFGELGQGAPMGHNAGFLRNDVSTGLSAIAIVIVTDEEDCSSKTTRHFTPDPFLPDSDPLKQQGLNTRCFHNKDGLFDLRERYYEGFLALRPGNEHLVSFSVIAGVPPELVTPERIAEAGFDNPMTRDAYYEALLAHPAMQEVIDDRGTPDTADDNLQPSCDRAEAGKAYPPRRLVELAQMFGENGVVQSICQDDFGPAMDAIISTISRQLGAACLPRALKRDSEGFIHCNVYWSLPAPSRAPAGTPTACNQESFLITSSGGRIQASSGGEVCRVAQLRVENDTFEPTEDPETGETHAEGFYYDDFTADVQSECATDPKVRIAFTPRAKPPTGVEVILDCADFSAPSN